MGQTVKYKNTSFVAKDESIKRLSENYMFHKIMSRNDNEIMKLLIYGLYKSDKVKYLVLQKNIHGKKPSYEELDSFQKEKIDDRQILVYEKEVDTILTRSFNDLLNKTALNMVSEKINELEKERKRLSWISFGVGVLQGVIATFLVMGITIIVLLNTNAEKLIEIQKIIQK